MFDIGTKIKRAWHTIWDYKILWIFVFIMVITGAGSGGGGGGGGGSSSNYSNRVDMSEDHGMFGSDSEITEWMNQAGDWMNENIAPLFETPEKATTTIIWIIVALTLLVLLIGCILAIVRYPSETAVIRMIDDYEQTGTKIGFKQGWKLGWNRRAFRLWVIDLLIGAPAFVLIMGMVVWIAMFTMRFIDAKDLHQIPGMVGGIALLILLIFIISLLSAFLGLLRQFFVREAALEDIGIGESIKRGWTMAMGNFKNAFLTWLVMLGIRIGFGFVLMLAAILLIPSYAILAIPGAVVSAVPGLITLGVSSLFTSAPWTWIIAALIAMPFFFTIVFSPVSLVNSWFVLFESSIWTQTYREMRMKTSFPPVMPSPLNIPQTPPPLRPE